MTHEQKIDILWDDNPVDISEEANFIWSIANKLRGTYAWHLTELKGERNKSMPKDVRK